MSGDTENSKFRNRSTSRDRIGAEVLRVVPEGSEKMFTSYLQVLYVHRYTFYSWSSNGSMARAQLLLIYGTGTVFFFFFK